jgi:hypothetical protein
MPVTLRVKSGDRSIERKRRVAASRVLRRFESQLPGLRLLCFLDEEDCEAIKNQFGSANRGFFSPVKQKTIDDLAVIDWPRDTPLDAFDAIIYLHGSTCSDETALVMTFPHELQHSIQYANARVLWAENTLAMNVITRIDWEERVSQQLLPFHLPTEVQARIVAKQVAESLRGVDVVNRYIQRKIQEAANDCDVRDWQFVSTLSPSSSCNLVSDTRLLFKRLEPYRELVAEVLRQVVNDPDFQAIDLASLFGSGELDP